MYSKAALKKMIEISQIITVSLCLRVCKINTTNHACEILSFKAQIHVFHHTLLALFGLFLNKNVS